MNSGQNLNQQSESVDLLGGFKPVELKTLCTPLKNKFEKLFPKTFSRKVFNLFVFRLMLVCPEKCFLF
jgi:midasin